MEISVVRNRVREAIERARRASAERRARRDDASRDYDRFLTDVAAPLFKQIANALRAEGYFFTVNTPAGSIRLASDKSAETYIELTLDTAPVDPRVIGISSHARGRRVAEQERPIADKPVRDITEDDVLAFVLKELEPLVER